MAENKLVKTVTGSVVLVGLSTGMGWLAKKALRESFIGDPSTSIMNYGKWQMGACADYSYVCQNIFRGSEDTTHKHMMAMKSFNVEDILDIAVYHYSQDLISHIRNANNNSLSYTEYKLNQGSPNVTFYGKDLKLEDIFEWYFCDEHGYHDHSKRTPDLNAYIIETLKNVSPKFKERYEAKVEAERKQECKPKNKPPRPLVSFMFGVLTPIVLYTGSKLFKK